MAGLLSARRVSATIGPMGPAGPQGPAEPPGSNGPAGASGVLSHFIVPIVGGVASTQNNGANPKRAGAVSVNPAVWNQLTNTSTIVLHVLLETTNGANAASASLLLYSGGAPSTLATVTTSALSMTELTVDVSTYFRPGASSGVYALLFNLATASGTDSATISGAWLDITP